MTTATLETPAACCTAIRSARPFADEQAAQSMMMLLRSGADVRQRKVRRVRAAVRVNAYENSLKLDVAIERLIALLEVTAD